MSSLMMVLLMMVEALMVDELILLVLRMTDEVIELS